MKVLVWVPPWVAQGHPLFFENAFRRHLMAQANLLAGAGATVTVVVGELLADRVSPSARVELRPISTAQAAQMLGTLSDPSLALYRDPQSSLTRRIADGVKPLLDDHYDVILLWETPVPFLEALFPESLILHQMPGAVSRPPFPHTVTADPLGLYRRGSSYCHASSIFAEPPAPSDPGIVHRFREHARVLLDAFAPFKRVDLDPEGRFSSLLLVPLQVSEHYAFEADTPYRTQSEFLLDVLHRVGPDVGVVVTQYVTPRVHDRIMTPEFEQSLRKRWPNLVYRPAFDDYSAVSQYLLPYVDAVCTCSSSLGLQAAFWDKTLIVPQPTYLERFADAATLEGVNDRSWQNSASLQRRERLLAYLLMRQQPLATALTEDAAFLTKYLRLLIDQHRKGREGDRTVHLNEVDENYGERLLASFRPAMAAKDARRGHPVYEVQARDAARFSRRLQRSDLRYVTFDVFDTLVNRAVLRPRDLYNFLQKRADELTGGRAVDFARTRLAAEVTTREESPHGEITLAEIYQTLNRHYALDEELLVKLQELEIEIEVALAGPREAGKRFWAIALQTRKPIVLITDMYLPRYAVERILTKCGYSGYHRMFLSSECRTRKREGGLFDIVLQELQVPGSELLHIGDHQISDVASPKARGIETYRVMAATERIEANERFNKRLRAGNAPSICNALVAHRLFDSEAGGTEQRSHFMGQPFYLGYAALGPIVASYAMWLHRTTAKHGIERLFFLSREGAILKQVYDVLQGANFDGPPSEYFLASRRALRAASIYSRSDLLSVAACTFHDEGTTVARLFEARFGLPEYLISESALRRAGYRSVHDRVSNSPTGLLKIGDLALALEDEIVRTSERERANYFKYIERTKLLETPKLALVDLGWAGNMQDSLQKLVGRSISGYYYATLETALARAYSGLVMHGFAGDFVVGDRHPSVVVARRPLAEYLLCSADPSLKCFSSAGAPVFQDGIEPIPRAELIRLVHDGIVAFSRDLVMRLGPLLVDQHIDPFTAEACYKDFIERPAPMDIALLQGHYQEDAFGGLPRRYFIAAGERDAEAIVRASYWKEGARAYVKKAQVNGSKHSPDARPVELNGTSFGHGVFGRVLKPVEQKAIQTFSSERKQRKYQRDRAAFFADSTTGLARRWGEWSGRLMNGQSPKSPKS